MKYKVGDKVRIKSLDWYNENKDEDGYVRDIFDFTPSMAQYCGQIFEIREVKYNSYCLKSTFLYAWTDEMIECSINDKPNLVEILKDCPKGTALYSLIYGEVSFEGIDNCSKYPIIVKCPKGHCHSTSMYGEIFADRRDTECIIFPSKENRDWSTFKVPRWRAKDMEPYWYITSEIEVKSTIEYHIDICDKRYDAGNYFRTAKEALNKAKEIKEILLK